MSTCTKVKTKIQVTIKERIYMEEVFSNYGIEIVVGMIFAVLATLFSRVIYFSYFNKK